MRGCRPPDQDPQLQLDALTAVDCQRIYTDHASGAATARPDLDRLLDTARADDTMVVWRLDRLGRSMRHLLELAADLEARGVGLRSLNEQIDTTTPPTADSSSTESRHRPAQTRERPSRR